ncbi:hypothetical protein [Nocardia miyunensis]|uniref:hypothetical protein n=1 Tax=Nocardia miyunensis TaxID=282684 RepID=UPI00083258AA|nr:hypothetical protein [Nocardia miyunensis]
MSEHLDFDYPLTPILAGGVRAEAAAHRAAALRQLRLAGTGDNPQSRLAAATVHVVAALTLLISEDVDTIDTAAEVPALPLPRNLRYSVAVEVLHNTNPDAATTGYTDQADELIRVYTYSDRDVADTVSDHEIAARVIGLFGAEPDSAAQQVDHRAANYFGRGNRPLTRGDVVAIDYRYYAFADIRTGLLAPITQPRLAVLGRPLPTGTTQL